ncbi:glycoside hydrolase family 25 protein [Streptomyces sp. NPDC050095]|uniref:glycoside hydrolase family 25 protein n=1 Tax=unclassified Streptomyces TaxID=2593676 RepID=UPI003446996D
MIRGIDVSAYQSSTFDTDGLSFVFIKATEGRSYVNPRLTAQTKHARDAGCVVGFYHFLWPGNLTAQAEYFVSKAPEKAGDLLAVDWETTGEGTRASNAEKDRFIREVKRLRPQHRVALYTNRDFWLNVDTTSYAGDALWIADYVTAGKPRIKAKWRFHQYTDTPHDKDVADFASEDALREWATP